MSKIVVPFPNRREAFPDAASLYAADGGRKYLNATERTRAMSAMAALPPERALFALMLAWTGARVSEVLALTPRSLQPGRGVVAFVTLKRRRHHVREVPIPPFLMQALEAHFDLLSRQQDETSAHTRLWPWHRSTGWQIIKRVMREAQIVGRAASPRGLRHGFAIGALQAGIPLTLVQRWLGHSQLSSTAIYADVSGPEEQAFAKCFWNEHNGADLVAALLPLTVKGQAFESGH